jgi:hypothetical protein
VQGLYTADPPVDYELRQAGQPTGQSYPQFNLHRKKPAEPRRSIWFISFSHEDQVFVDKHVVEILERKGIETWISRTKSKRGKRGRTSIKPGKQWMDEITKGLQNANRVLVIVSKNSAKSDWVKREVRVAMIFRIYGIALSPFVLTKHRLKMWSCFFRQLRRLTIKTLPNWTKTLNQWSTQATHLFGDNFHS